MGWGRVVESIRVTDSVFFIDGKKLAWGFYVLYV